MSSSIRNRQIPYGISEYIKKNFTEDFLFDVKEYKKIKGQWEYTVEVTKDDVIHRLRFDEQGVLLKEETDLAFPPDAHEGNVPDEIPE